MNTTGHPPHTSIGTGMQQTPERARTETFDLESTTTLDAHMYVCMYYI